MNTNLMKVTEDSIRNKNLMEKAVSRNPFTRENKRIGIDTSLIIKTTELLDRIKTPAPRSRKNTN